MVTRKELIETVIAIAIAFILLFIVVVVINEGRDITYEFLYKDLVIETVRGMDRR